MANCELVSGAACLAAVTMDRSDSARSTVSDLPASNVIRRADIDACVWQTPIRAVADGSTVRRNTSCCRSRAFFAFARRYGSKARICSTPPGLEALVCFWYQCAESWAICAASAPEKWLCANVLPSLLFSCNMNFWSTSSTAASTLCLWTFLESARKYLTCLEKRPIAFSEKLM